MEWALNNEAKINTARLPLTGTLQAGGAFLMIKLCHISMSENHPAYFFGKSLKEPVGLRSDGTALAPETLIEKSKHTSTENWG